MKRLSRQIISLAVVSLLFAGLVSTTATATVGDTDESLFTFVANDSDFGTAKLIEYLGGRGPVVIPSRALVDGERRPVTAIGTGAFDVSFSDSHVTVPASVTKIESGAFGENTPEALVFLGSAPEIVVDSDDSSIPLGTIISFYDGAEGFTDGWMGYATNRLTPSSFEAEVTPGTLSATLGAISFGEVAYSHSPKTHNAESTLTVTDLTGSGNGWAVSMRASDFVWTADDAVTTNADLNIPASQLSFVSDSEFPLVVERVAGQAAAGIGTGGADDLESFVPVVSAPPNAGEGKYTVKITFALAIPGFSRAGTYGSTITTSIASAP